jgi:hypothetical protein
VTGPDSTLGIDAGLLARYRDAGEKIAWRAAPRGTKRPRGRTARIAHLHDESARIEQWGTGAKSGIAVDSGPVGALVILLEIDRRGPPSAIGAQDAGRDPAFGSGSLIAAWGGDPMEFDSRPTLNDLVKLARYALA